jgi:hypothetical protein
VIVCLSVKRIILEPTYEDFQKQVYEDFKMKYTRTLIFSFQSNEATVLDHIVPTTFSINSVELELHDRKVCFAHLCYGLTNTDLSFLENLRSNWVVIIVLDLLSLACLGLGLGSCYVTSSCLCHPCRYYDYFDPISVENRIWGDRNETCRCDANGSRLCPVRCWKPVASYHTQI